MASKTEGIKSEAMDGLKRAGTGLLKAAGDKAISTASDRVSDLTDRFEDVADGGPIKQALFKGAEAKMGGESPVKGALKGLGSGVKDAVTGGKGGGKKGGGATKSTNILQTIDVGVPIDVAYNTWTEFGAFPSFMKKVENVEAQDETKINWKAQIFWSHRTWEATILDQIPNERIIWRSKGQKGHVDGAVTFHEITPTLTRIMVVLEYYPQGLFEKTGNIWRAQGRRARADLRHFKRHVMTRSILEAEEIEGWRGIIEDGEVVKSHEEVVEEEEAQAEQDDQDDQDAEDDYDDEGEPEDEYDEEGEPEDEQEDEPEDEPEDEYDEVGDEEGEPEDEYDEEGEPEAEQEDEPEDDYDEEGDEEAEPEDEYDEAEDEDEPRSRRRRAS
jgi:uncharacterized membrane protein